MQVADTKPGAYYVTVADAGRVSKLLGPFIDDHAGALAMVEKVRAKAEELDYRAVFYSFGTCRVDADNGPGLLNKYFVDIGK